MKAIRKHTVLMTFFIFFWVANRPYQGNKMWGHFYWHNYQSTVDLQRLCVLKRLETGDQPSFIHAVVSLSLVLIWKLARAGSGVVFLRLRRLRKICSFSESMDSCNTLRYTWQVRTWHSQHTNYSVTVHKVQPFWDGQGRRRPSQSPAAWGLCNRGQVSVPVTLLSGPTALIPGQTSRSIHPATERCQKLKLYGAQTPPRQQPLSCPHSCSWLTATAAEHPSNFAPSAVNWRQSVTATPLLMKRAKLGMNQLRRGKESKRSNVLLHHQ